LNLTFELFNLDNGVLCKYLFTKNWSAKILVSLR